MAVDPAVEAVVEAVAEEGQVVVAEAEAAVALLDLLLLECNLVVRRYNSLIKVLISDPDQLL